jgi:hypothetical protein
MIRTGVRSWRIGGPLLCVLAALAVAAPATAFGQAAVDEYTLDIPGSPGSNPSDPTAPTSASAAGSSKGTNGEVSGNVENAAGVASGAAAGLAGTASDRLNLSDLQKGSGHAALPTTSRSVPEVVADSVTNTSMLPIVGALVLITGLGAWRLVRSKRNTLSGAPS